MSTVVIKKYVLDGIIELLREYDTLDEEVYDNLVKETPVDKWHTLKELVPFVAHSKLKQIEFCLDPDHQAQLKKIYISEQPDLQNEMANADPDSIFGLAHSMKKLSQESELIYFVTDGEGNAMLEGVNLETAHEFAARRPEYSVGR